MNGSFTKQKIHHHILFHIKLYYSKRFHTISYCFIFVSRSAVTNGSLLNLKNFVFWTDIHQYFSEHSVAVRQIPACDSHKSFRWTDRSYTKLLNRSLILYFKSTVVSCILKCVAAHPFYIAEFGFFVGNRPVSPRHSLSCWLSITCQLVIILYNKKVP